MGIGDDAALLQVPRGSELILTTDMSIEGVHFTFTHHPPRAVGHRALARSLSDIAAMGGTPRFALLSLAVSPSAHRAWLESFFAGFWALARRFNVALIGGDTAVVNGPCTADVIVTGETPRGTALRRSGAKPGDQIFVSGRLGLAALGLRLLLSGSRSHSALDEAARRAHLFPEPQCALGRFLREQRLASAMMDLSDGLSVDLPRLCKASSVGATLFAERLPTVKKNNAEDGRQLALHGGEDYQLLFTVPVGRAARVPAGVGRTPLTCIGEICAGPGVEIVSASGTRLPVQARGWDHFARPVIECRARC